MIICHSETPFEGEGDNDPTDGETQGHKDGSQPAGGKVR